MGVEAVRSVRPTIDIGAIADDGAWTGPRKQVLLLCALAIVLDGLDNQILGFAIPSMIKEWNVARGDFASALALGFVGMTIGTPIGGILGDRIGRKAALTSSVILFGLATLAIGFASSVFEVITCRFIAGLGLGGALPVATALISEFTPKNRRSMSVMLGIVSIPVGGFVAGILAAQLQADYGWRVLFIVSGALPLLVAGVLIALLPDSPQYLIARGADKDKVLAAVRILDANVPADGVFVDQRDGRTEGVSIKALFTGGFLRTTVALWIGFFFCLLPVFVIYGWAPTLLVGAGLDGKSASFGLAIFNFGGVAGCIATAWAIGRYGSRVGILGAAAAAITGASVLAILPLSASIEPLLLALLFVLGFFLLGAQGSLYVLAAYVYPAAVRSTGVGAAAGFGRAGAIVSAYVGTVALNYGTVAFFGLVAACVAVTFICVAVINIHAAPLRANSVAATTREAHAK